MFQVFRNAFKIPDLRKKLLYTLMIIVIFRIGAAIPVPFLDANALKDMVSGGGNFLGYIDVLTGGAFASATIFAMSITPYINASIIIQLLTVAIPALERMQKEGEEGRKKLNKITRFTTIVLGLTQATAYYFLVRNKGAIKAELTSGWDGWFAAIVIILVFTAGTALIMWLGEQVNEKGIGNGISIILFAGIISRGPSAIGSLVMLLQQGSAKNYILVPLIVIIFIAIISFIIIMTNAERRIPVQYAKRVVGRKQYGGQSSHIPIKVSMSGVMPIIFASSLMSIPGTISSFAPPKAGTFFASFMKAFDYTGWIYAVLYFFLIIAFNYFYVAIQYNPIEISNNLRKNNGGIPGIRPGKPTSDFISKVLSKITLVGALFLGAIAIFPIIFTGMSGINIALGGTTVLIIVGVALETMRTLESQMMMRHHKGFLE
jgi:preprotein translocase subunit SecY